MLRAQNHKKCSLSVTPRPLDEFEQRWLAEAICLRETRDGRLDDAAANRAARAAAGNLETRLRHRAEALAEAQGGLREALIRWQSRAALSALALGALAVFAGSGMAAAVLGDGRQPVNVVWALGGLLGVHLMTLLLWLAAGVGASTGGGSLAGRLWIAATAWLGRRHGEAWLPQAMIDMTRTGHVLTAWLGRLSHGLWSLTLGSALLTLLLMLSTKRYGFVWETTILSDEVFVTLTLALGKLPALLGLAMPDADVVRRAAGPAAVAGDRQLWSAWLIAALVLYGLLPRLTLWVWCQSRWTRFRARFRLDPAKPGYAQLTRLLMPTSEAMGVNDTAPDHLPTFHAEHSGAVVNGPHLALALELGPDLPWPPDALPAAHTGGRLDGREARRTMLDTLAAQPVERLLIAVDARLSPDRGALALLAELSRYAHRLGVWLNRADDNAERSAHWHDALAQLGIASADRVTLAEAARQWLDAQDG